MLSIEIPAAAPADETGKTLGQIAYDALKAMILSGEIRPGERLAERELARRLNVSRTPLREALGWLTRDGLAVSRPGQGYYMIEFDSRVIAELYEFRATLEVHASTAAAERISDAGIAEISAVMEQLAVYERAEAPTLEQLRDEVHLGLRIHEIIARECGNSFVREALLQVYDRLRLFTWIDGLWFDKWALTRAEHRALVAAVTARDPAAAARAARHHVQRAGDDASWVIKAHQPDRGTVHPGEAAPAR